MPTIGIVSETAKIKWEIPRFLSALKSSKKQPISSPTFSFSNSEWFLQTFLQNKYIVISLTLKSNSCVKTVDCNIYLKDAYKSILLEKSFMSNVFDSSCGTLRWPCMTCETCYSRKRKDWVSRLMDTITVECHLKESKSTAMNRPLDKFERFDVLSSNLKDTFIKKEACDVCLKVGEKTFDAHKFILTARSPVFAAMFKSHTSEQQSGIVTITDCDQESFGDFLEYLYTGTIGDVSFDKARELYVTADKYDVLDLKSFCVSSMVRDLDIENACDVIVFADLYGDSDLLFSCLDFFNRNLDRIFASPKWLDLLRTNTPLANKLLKSLASQVKLEENVDTLERKFGIKRPRI